MEKMLFQIGKRFISSIGSMDEIEGMMSPSDAFRVLLGACYRRADYPMTAAVISQIMDDKDCVINCPPVQAANQLMEADTALPMPRDIFAFVEKAYLDGHELNEPRWCSFQLGRLYSEERFRSIDHEKAFCCFESSARSGSGAAEAKLGKYWLMGNGGVGRHEETAFRLLTKWALLDAEHSEARCLLADMYREGIYVQKDEVQAFEMYRDIAWEGDNADPLSFSWALMRAADYYADRMGREEALSAALEYYQRAECKLVKRLLAEPEAAAAGVAYARAGQTRVRRKLARLLSRKKAQLG